MGPRKFIIRKRLLIYRIMIYSGFTFVNPVVPYIRTSIRKTGHSQKSIRFVANSVKAVYAYAAY